MDAKSTKKQCKNMKETTRVSDDMNDNQNLSQGGCVPLPDKGKRGKAKTDMEKASMEMLQMDNASSTWNADADWHKIIRNSLAPMQKSEEGKTAFTSTEKN